jgi:hypothetical protein
MTLNDVSGVLTIDITFTDPKAIEIIQNLPEDKRDNVIEKYIILGDMVVTHASISTSKESVENFFAPLKQDILLIREQLKMIVPTIMTPSKKGEVTVEAIFKSFEEHFMDDSFEDVSGISKYTDIFANISETKTPILIEIKDYSGEIPTSQVDKFWRDMEVRDVKYGIFISMRSKIAKCSSCINLQHNLKRTAIFVVNSELNWSGHIFAFYITKKLVELEQMKKKDIKEIDISSTITKINNSITVIKNISEDLERIKIISESLKTTSTNRLDEITSIVRVYQNQLNEEIEKVINEIGKVSE